MTEYLCQFERRLTIVSFLGNIRNWQPSLLLIGCHGSLPGLPASCDIDSAKAHHI